MATSDAMSTSNQYIKYTISITQNSQNVTNNTSNVTVSVRFYRTNTGYSSYGTGTVYCKIDGTTYSASVNSSQAITNSGIVLFTQTLNIGHNTDGTKTLTCSAWISHDVVTSSEQSYSETLTTIPRTSNPSLSPNTVDMGQKITIYTNRASGSFTHTIYYSWHSSGLVKVAENVGDSYTWTVPLSLADYIPNATQSWGTIRCVTYSGGTEIGTKDVTFTANVPASVVPTVAIAISDSTGYATTYGAYIQNKSKFQIAITASGAYSSTIKSYSTTADGSTYTAATFETPVIKNAGTLTISATATDSRTRSKIATATAEVLEYSAPKITNYSVKRCDSAGVSTSNGEYLAVTFDSSITSLNSQNTASYTVSYKKTSATDYTEETLTDYAGVYSVSGATYIFEADTASSYDIVISATDAFSTSNASATGSSISKLFSFLKKGLGIAFGKVAEIEDTVEFGLKAAFNQDIIINDNILADFVIEQGTSGVWNYRKWNSGFAELWANIFIDNITLSSYAGGSCFVKDGTTPTFPFSIIAGTNTVASITTFLPGTWGNINYLESSTTEIKYTVSCVFEVNRDFRVYISVHARWK